MNSNHASMTLSHHDPNAIKVVIGRKSRVATNTVFLPADALDIRLQGVKWEHEEKIVWQLLHDDGIIVAFSLWGDEPPYFVNAEDFPTENRPYVMDSILAPKLGNLKPCNSKRVYR